MADEDDDVEDPFEDLDQFIDEFEEAAALSLSKLVKLASKLRRSRDIVAFRRAKDQEKAHLADEFGRLFGFERPGRAVNILQAFNRKVAELEFGITQSVATFSIDGVTIVIMGHNIVPLEDKYAAVMKEAKRRLDSHGLSAAWYGTFYIVSNDIKRQMSKEDVEAYRKVGIEKLVGAVHGAEYYDAEDKLVFGDFSSGSSIKSYTFLYVIFHELGHRYYYKILPKRARQRWINLLKTKVRSYDEPDAPGEETDEGEPAPVEPVSEYAATNADEAFAEAFAHFCVDAVADRPNDEGMTPVQLSFFQNTVRGTFEETLRRAVRQLILLNS